MKKITTVIVTGAAAATFGSMPAQAQCNPCNPCAAQTAVNPCNPCAAANPCNPCAARNPCNPCAANPCNPCAANPCGVGQAAGPVDDPMAEATVKSYKDWRRVNDEPVLSATHGNRWVVTYINEQAESAGLSGDLPFAPGAILAKASFENVNGKPGTPGPLFIMEKRDAGYDPERADWHYAMVVKGVVARAGNAQAGSTVKFCSDCHMAVKAQDYVYGNGTVMKLK